MQSRTALRVGVGLGGIVALALSGIVSLLWSSREANAIAMLILARAKLTAPVMTGAPPGMAFAGDGLGIDDNDISGGAVNGVTILPCVGGGGPPGRPPFSPLNSMVKITTEWGACVWVSTGTTIALTEMSPTEGTTAQFTVDVEGGAPCGGGCGAAQTGSGPGGGGDCASCGGDGSGPMFTLSSALVRLPLGMAHPELSAGVLRIHAEEPDQILGTPAGLEYDLAAQGYLGTEPVHVVKVPETEIVRQVRTPELLADVSTDDMDEDATKYFVSLYPRSAVGNFNYPEQAYDLTGDAFRVWEISVPGSGVDLLVVDRVWNGTGYDIRGKYRYSYDNGDWTLITTNAGDSVLRTEELSAWDEFEPGEFRKRYYTVRSPDNTLIYQHTEEETAYFYYDGQEEPTWRRTALIVDEGGLERTTTWTYAVQRADEENVGDKYHGVVLQSVRRPDGSWSWYNIRPVDINDPDKWFPDTEWMIQEISGFKDEPFPTGGPPDFDGENVQSATRIYKRYYDGEGYEGLGRYPLKERYSYVAGRLVEKTVYDHQGFTWLNDPPDPEDPDQTATTTETRWTSGSGSLVTEYQWPYARTVLGLEIEYIPRLSSIELPSGLTQTFVFAGANFTESTFPSPHTYSTGGENDPEEFESLYRYREVQNGNVAGKSTKRITILDRVGRVLHEETRALVGQNWVVIGWASSKYDVAGRLTERWRNDGSHEAIDYSSCCTTETSDAGGVTTAVSHDALGRVTSIQRSAPGQTTITTSYSYSTPFQETVTTSAGSLSQSLVRTFDMAGRLTSVTTGSSTGAIKTLYAYGIGSGGGQVAAVYRDYPSSATQGVAGTRDHVTERYRDGSVKHISGSAVTEARYDYGAEEENAQAGTGRTWVEVEYGPTNSGRTEKTVRDMLGRVQRAERPGWSASSPVTLTTEHFYDGDTGWLVKTTEPGRAPTLYTHDEFGNVLLTALDVDEDGQIDLGGPDRITKSETTFEYDGPSDYWQVARSWVYESSTPTLTGTSKTRLTGYTGSDTAEFVTRETESIDIHGNITTTTVELERDAATRTETTCVPDSSQPAVHVYEGGRLVSSTSQTGVETSYGYDALGRRSSVTDGRGNTTTTGYDTSGRVSWIKDEDDNQTDYVYYAGSEDDLEDPDDGVYPGRLKYVENPADKKTRFAYDDRGQTTRTWGDVPYPTENVYDDFGQRTQLKTYRGGSGWNGTAWPSSPGDADVTTWAFDDATGLLETKTYADDSEVNYTYYEDGDLYTRQWARHGSSVVTAYAYDEDTGELTDVVYDSSWGMTNLNYTYDRLGRRETVTDVAGVREFAYNATLAQTTETFTSGMFEDLVITQVYQSGSGSGIVPGRWAGVQVGNVSDPDAQYAAVYAHDGYGRLNRVTGPGLPAGTGDEHGAWYTFVTDSDLLDRLQFKDSSGNVKGWTDWSYEPHRDLVTAVENNFGDLTTYTTISKYAYGTDNLARREYVVRTGAAFAQGHQDDWSYNDRNEITLSKRYNNTTPGSTQNPDAQLDRDYDYDPIGNRTSYTAGEGSSAEQQTDYLRNNLNQYSRADTTGPGAPVKQHLTYDADGNLSITYVVGDLNCDGAMNNMDIDPFVLALSDPEEYAQQYPNCDILNADANGDGLVNNGDIDAFVELLTGGNAALHVQYTWDGENRLIRIEPGDSPASGAKKVEFKYDYLGRRIEKKAYTYNGSSWSLTETRRFIWNNWLLLLELDGDGNVLRKLTWGRDLGSVGVLAGNPLDGAGGIGGLLAIQDANGTTTGENHESDDLRYVYFYDANGNVGQVIDLNAASASASIKAHYEYDAYGKVLVQSGSYASANPYRFSTKPWDDEIGLGYWGLRYFDPRLGRWTSHDPMEEAGGENLYAYIFNRPTSSTDYLGLASTCDLKVKRSAICKAFFQSEEADYGHEWIDDPAGGPYDFPPNYVDGVCHKYDRDNPVKEWDVDRKKHGRLPGGTKCSEATCDDIRQCLQDQEDKRNPRRGGHGPKCQYSFLFNNCITFVDDAFGKCCLSRGKKTRDENAAEEQRRCEERKKYMHETTYIDENGNERPCSCPKSGGGP